MNKCRFCNKEIVPGALLCPEHQAIRDTVDHAKAKGWLWRSGEAVSPKLRIYGKMEAHAQG